MSAASSMLPVAEALARVLASAPEPLESQRVPLMEAFGRTLAADIAARRTQPPFAVSAMDGYALRAADIASPPAQLRMIGISAAGHGFAGTVGPGETVRIFTGAPVPDGADTVLMQEDARADGDAITALQADPRGRSIRRAGLDFSEGEVLLHAGRRLGPSDLALAGAMNHDRLPVVRKPIVAILATGDELVLPGQNPGPDQIVASNTFAVAAYARAAGAEVVDLGIAIDTYEALETSIRQAREARADIFVTLGGASVGDHDLVQTALAREGMELGFWQIALRPGKPLMHGRLGDMRILGLPGNPVSSIVCTILFLVPLIRALSGDREAGRDISESARLGVDVPANDIRQDYVRSEIKGEADGLSVVVPKPQQDSSMLRFMAQSQCLLIRAPLAKPAKAGELCRIIRLTPPGF